jgi:hypothetical protein
MHGASAALWLRMDWASSAKILGRSQGTVNSTLFRSTVRRYHVSRAPKWPGEN